MSMWAQLKSHPFATSGSLYVPAGITIINAKAWGGGGAGGSATTPAVLFGRAGAGGGAGAYAAGPITVIPGSTIATVVAVQTAGGPGNGNAGGHSTITGFENIIYAGGGAGGGGNTAGGTPTGGAGGVATVAAGVTATNGGAGVNGVTGLLAITESGKGGDAPNTAGGGGTGGAAINSNLGSVTTAGLPGNPFGGGGSGAVHSNNSLATIQNGGAGARGHIILEYTCNTYSLSSTTALNTCISAGTTTVNLTSSAANLPVGTYTVTYTRGNPSQAGLTATMTVTTAGTGSFTATGLTNVGTSTITVTNLASGDCTYAVSAGNVSNALTISPLSVGGSVTPNRTICSGFTSGLLTLGGSTGTVLRWESSVSPFSTWTPISNTLTTYTSGALTQTTQFRAVVQSGTCAIANSGVATITVNPLPTITLGAVAAVCTSPNAQNTTLAYNTPINSPTNYSIVWNASPTNSFAAVNDATLPATPITIAVPAGTLPGTYTGTITVRNANNCTSSPGLPFSVVVNPLPTITLGTVAPVCTSASAQNTTLAYNATSNSPTTYSITWSGSPTNSFAPVTNAALPATPITIAVPAGTAAGTYTGTLTVANGNSCVSSPGVGFSVVVNPLPTITLGTVAPVCTSVSAQNTTLAYTATSNSPTTYSITWSGSPTNSFAPVTNAALTATPITIAVPAGTAAGTYTGTITVANGNSCVSSPGVGFSVVVNPLPTITLGAVAPVCTSASAQNTTLAYTATSNSPTTYSITWGTSPTNSFATVTNASLPATPITIAVPAGTAAGTYTGTLTVANANSCVASAGVPFSVVVNPLPTITLGAVAPVCTSASAQNTTLTYTATSNSPTTYSITWGTSPTNSFAAVVNASLPATPITIAVPAGTAAGTYAGTLTVANANSCVASAGVPFSVVVNPLPTITLGTVAPVCASANAQSTTLAYTATSNSPTTYSITWGASPTNSFAAVTNAALSASPINIAVPAGTAAGTYTGTLTVTNANSCTSTGVPFSVVVNPLPTITIGAVAPVCASASAQNTTIAYSGTTNSATTYSITWSPSPTNTFAPITNLALTTSPIIITVPAGTLAGTYNGTITVTNPNSCTSNPGVNFNVVVYPLPASPVIGTITNATCLVATGSVALSGLPSGGILTRYPGAIVEPYTGTTTTISGLSPNTYTFTVSNSNCTSLISANAVISGVITNIYTTSWSNGTPTEDQNIVFAGNFVSAGGGAGDIRACSCTVNSGVSITIGSLDTLTLTNSLTNNGGSMIFENNASLLQITNAVNTGNITYRRTTTPIVRGDFVYWSTPVNPQRLIDVSPLTAGDKYMGYNGDNWVVTSPTSNMMIGKGYIIRAPQTYSLTNKVTYTASFIGKPNNGDLFGETVAAGKFYLIGNPYPSAMDANLFLGANTFLGGTLYFWTHNTSVDLVGAYRYTSADYASYNLTGGVATAAPAPSGTPQNNNSSPTGKIGAGQSFFATTINSGTVAFTNSMRLGGVNNSQFFKTTNTTNDAIVEKHRVWLNMTNTEGAFKQTLIGYIEGATNDFENMYDGKTFDGNPYLDFYSIGNENKYVIQGRGLPFADNDIVPLGYRSTITGDFTISIDHADGDLSNHAIYLEDKVTNTIHDLQTGDYTFSTMTGTFTDRFVLSYTNKTLGNGEFETTDKNVLVAVQNKTITITSTVENIATVYIYDLSGKLVHKTTNVSDTILKINNLKISDQVLFVKVILDTNVTKTYKIVF